MGLLYRNFPIYLSGGSDGSSRSVRPGLRGNPPDGKPLRGTGLPQESHLPCSLLSLEVWPGAVRAAAGGTSFGERGQGRVSVCPVGGGF